MIARWPILCAAAICLGNAPAKPDVSEVESTRTQALLDNDIAALDALTADEFIHVDSNGRVRNKVEFISGRQSGRVFSLFVNDEIDVRYYGDTAVVTGGYRNAFAGSDESGVKHARFIRIYVLRDGRWQNVAHQATEIARPE